MSATSRAPDWSGIRARFGGPVAVRAIRDGLSIAGLVVLLLFMLSDGPGYDFFAYWSVNPADPYAVKEGFGAYHYAPPLVWLVGPLKLLPWPAAYWVWFVVLFAVLVWLARDWAFAWLAFPPLASELFHGNIHLLIAAALVVSLRYPAGFAFLALSKVSPGVTVLWWVVRREWRPLMIALGTAGAVIVVSIALTPGLWVEYVTHIATEANHAPNLIAIPLLVRLPFAAALVSYAAWRDRPWLLAPAVVLALPLLWVHGLAILVAVTPLLRRSRARRETLPADRTFGALPPS
jgi:glycosyl transferase family 87